MALTDNLQACWELDNVNDAHNANTLTNTGSATFAPAKVGNGVDLNGSSQYLSIADNPVLSMGDIDFTIQAWVKFNDLGSTHVVLGKGQVAGPEYILYSNASAEINFRVDNGIGFFPTAVFSGASTDTWYHLIGYHNATTDEIGLIVNNGTPATVSYTHGSQDSGSSFMIGEDGSGARWMNGIVDQVAIWKRVLTGAEIAELYNGGSGLSYAAMSGGGGGGGVPVGSQLL